MIPAGHTDVAAQNRQRSVVAATASELPHDLARSSLMGCH